MQRNFKIFLNVIKKYGRYSKTEYCLKNIGESLLQVDNATLLGIYIEDNLGWKEHIVSLSTKFSLT